MGESDEAALENYSQIRDVLMTGEVKSAQNRRACMTRVLNVEEAREIFKDRIVLARVLPGVLVDFYLNKNSVVTLYYYFNL